MNFRTWMVIDDFYLSIQYYLLNFNSPIYADCKAFFAPIWDHFFAHFNSRTYTDCKTWFATTDEALHHFNSRTYTDCKYEMGRRVGIDELFQLTHVYGLQGHGINPSSCFALRICFRKLHPKDAPSRSTQVRFAQIVVSCWTYFLPGFCRAVPVISTPALLGSGKSKRTQLCCYPIL